MASKHVASNTSFIAVKQKFCDFTDLISSLDISSSQKMSSSPVSLYIVA